MKKSATMMSGFAAGLILVVVGFSIGLYTNKVMNSAGQKPPPSTTSRNHTGPDDETYNIDVLKPVLAMAVSPPSQGRANITIPVTFQDVFAQQAFVILDINEAKNIKPGQKILLYDKDNQLLPAAGTITSTNIGMGDGMHDSIIVHISLGAHDAPPHHGKIVIEAIPQSYRLPLTALSYTDDGRPFLWEAIRDKNDDDIYKTKSNFVTNLRVVDDLFFVMDRPAYTSNLFLLNPEGKITEGQSIEIIQALYRPADQPNADYLLQTTRKPLNLKNDLNAAPLGGADAGCPASACGGADGASAFIETIKALSKNLPPQTKPVDPMGTAPAP